MASASAIPGLLDRIGGRVEEEELRYQLDRRGVKFDRNEIEYLIEQGYVEQIAGTREYQAVVPRRRQRTGSPTNGYKEEEILDRIRLWAVLTGKPPTKVTWSTAHVKRQLKALWKKIGDWQDILDLWEAGDWPSEHTVRNRFGSLNAALVLCGFEPRSAGNQPKDRDFAGSQPRYGPDVLREAYEWSERARRAADPDELHDALYEMAVAAMAEADNLE